MDDGFPVLCMFVLLAGLFTFLGSCTERLVNRDNCDLRKYTVLFGAVYDCAKRDMKNAPQT